MASRLHSFARPAAAAFLRSAASRSPAGSLPRSLAPVPRAPGVGRRMALARSLQPLHSAVSAARLTSRLGAEVARAVSQETGLSVPR
ncbi:protein NONRESPONDING TO OXYLIPINS 2, mitochondrial-like isoform X2 [Panicum virgatum]|uniref:protein NONRESPONDING TO OXYLIPINS 2, mitochondrial-like isoform X2 n=1 Tax=Panicum virgatum TaxID=38727 RepID=UPI0019D50CF3|nr:protein NONRESPONDING TO OXYLIPINS 2, mitochondrial-like isoform X2 [Panicum virgatum]